MNYVDFTILLIAVVGFLYGLIKGVIRQVGSLGGFIAGIVVSRFFGNSFSALLRVMFDLPEHAGPTRVVIRPSDIEGETKPEIEQAADAAVVSE